MYAKCLNGIIISSKVLVSSIMWHTCKSVEAISLVRTVHCHDTFCIVLHFIELCLALIDAANDKQQEVRQMIMTSLHELGKKQPEMVLSAIKGYLIKHQKVHVQMFILMLNSLSIYWWAWERCLRDVGAEIWAEHGGIHCNPGSGNHQALSHWQSQSRYLPSHTLTVSCERESGDGAKALNRCKWHSKTNCTFSHSWQAKHISPAKLRWNPTEFDRPERPLANISLTQTLPQFHLTPYNQTKIVYIRVSQSLTYILSFQRVITCVKRWLHSGG